MQYLDLIQTVGLPYQFYCFFSKDIKKSSENDPSTGHFQSFFSHTPDPKSEKKSCKSTNKNFCPYHIRCWHIYCMVKI